MHICYGSLFGLEYDEILHSTERYYTQAVLLEYIKNFPLCTICTLKTVPSLSFLISEWTLNGAVEDSAHKLNTMLGITCTTLTVQLYSLVLRKIAIKGIMFPSVSVRSKACVSHRQIVCVQQYLLTKTEYILGCINCYHAPAIIRWISRFKWRIIIMQISRVSHARVRE